MNLRTPGPTPIPQDILNALSGPMIDHRGPYFRDIYDRVSANLKQLFETQNDVLMLTSSGSGGLEAAVVNTLSPGEPVLAVEIGAFGVRLGRMAETFGADVRWQRVEWGQAATAGVRRRVPRRQSGRDLRPDHPQRDLYRRHEPHRGDRAGRQAARQAAHRGCRLQPRLTPLPGGRMGH